MIEKVLIEAKIKPYANKKVPRISSSRLNSKDYEYSNGNMIYHDTYFGELNFIGEEVVYVDNQIYWAMNYYGVTLDQSLGGEIMDKVLRPALMKVGEEENLIPVRGPREFVVGEYRYTFEVVGDMTYFNGIEKIYKNDIEIYNLRCTGGLIK